MTLSRKFAWLLIPFWLTACGSDVDEEEDGAPAGAQSAPKKKKKKKGKEPSTVGKDIFIQTCKEVYDGFFDGSGAKDKTVKLFDSKACSAQLLEAFYERRDANPKDSISFTTDHVLYEMSQRPQYWSQAKKDKMRKLREQREAARRAEKK